MAGRLEVDHVVPLHKGGGELDPRELPGTLCRGCHIAKTRIENRTPDTLQRTAWRALVEDTMKHRE